MEMSRCYGFPFKMLLEVRSRGQRWTHVVGLKKWVRSSMHPLTRGKSIESTMRVFGLQANVHNLLQRTLREVVIGKVPLQLNPHGPNMPFHRANLPVSLSSTRNKSNVPVSSPSLQLVTHTAAFRVTMHSYRSKQISAPLIQFFDEVISIHVS